MVHVPDCLIFLEFFAGPHIVPATAAKQSNVVAQGWPQKGELPAALRSCRPHTAMAEEPSSEAGRGARVGAAGALGALAGPPAVALASDGALRP